MASLIKFVTLAVLFLQLSTEVRYLSRLRVRVYVVLLVIFFSFLIALFTLSGIRHRFRKGSKSDFKLILSIFFHCIVVSIMY